ncbi:MAG: hypothetical protein FWD85_01270 [Microbacteriaceae bacterium]|nr:hypothetical protein [Microbacteriaceae bacterium]MCL2793918.1 hypothetical protein [Microbacteriaceae bacterium]
MTTSTEVSWQLDDITMYGTVTVPDGTGPFPAVAVVAGSGPTDRDWNSPMLPGTNGSGKLLAEALAEAGFASIRYDKRASGPHVMENLPRLIGTFSMASHLAELEAAVAALAAEASVDITRLAGLGNSEGTLHVLHYANSGQRMPLAAVVLAAPPGRPVGEVLRTQLTAQLALVGAAEHQPLLDAAMERYSAGEPMAPDVALPEQLRQLLLSFEAPANLPLARELWNEGAAAGLAEVAQPTLVLLGEKDLQVDARADGGPLEAAAAERPNVAITYLPNANHILKEELRPMAEVAQAPGTNYNEDGTRLDPQAVDAIVAFLREKLR